MQKILITGATGFIGSQLVRSLLKTRKYKIRIFIRKQSSLARIKDVIDQLEVFHGDYYNEKDISCSLEGTDILIHLAAVLSIGRKKDYKKFNINVSKLFFTAACKNKLKKIIYISSLAVMGGAKIPYIYTEEDLPHPKTYYARSKWEVEQFANELIKKKKMNITILRAPAVYGENDNFDRGFLHIFDMIARNKYILIGTMQNKISFIYVHNLVDAIITCLRDRKSDNNTYLVSDKEIITTRDFIKLIYKETGANLPKIIIPKFIMKVLEFLVLNYLPFYPKHYIDDVTNNYACSIQKIRKELNWQPPYTLYQGIKRTIQWYRKQK